MPTSANLRYLLLAEIISTDTHVMEMAGELVDNKRKYAAKGSETVHGKCGSG
jgi:hypothetical protein